MSQVATKPRRTKSLTQTADRRDPVLRDLAFVLALTRRVKDSILDAKPLVVVARA